MPPITSLEQLFQLLNKDSQISQAPLYSSDALGVTRQYPPGSNVLDPLQGGTGNIFPPPQEYYQQEPGIVYGDGDDIFTRNVFDLAKKTARLNMGYTK